MTARRAMITGGAGGIGAAVAKSLAADGVEVVVSDLDPAACDAVTQDIAVAGHAAETCAFDVSDRGAVENAFRKQSARGGIDILVTAAAIVKAAPILEFDPDDWRRILEVNLTGTFHCAQLAGRAMVARGFGRIITISSINGQIANAGRGAYACTKGGVDVLTKLLAAELGQHGVTANAIAPGVVDTPMILQVHGRQDRHHWHERIPARRYAQPDEISAAVRFLASDDAGYVNGHILNIDGGFMASGLLPEMPPS